MSDWVTVFGTSLTPQQYSQERLTGSAAHLSLSGSASSMTRSAGGIYLVANGYGKFNIGSTAIEDIYGHTSFLVHVVNGAIVWSRKLGSSLGYYVLHSTSDTDGLGNFIVSSQGAIYKFGPGGDLLWKLPLPNNGIEHARAIASFDDGSAIILGSISNTYTAFDFGTGSSIYGDYNKSNFTGTGYVAKVSSNGNIEWATKIHSGGPILAGYQDALDTFGDGSFVFQYAEMASAGYSDYQLGFRVEKRSNSGSLIWSVQSKGAFSSALAALDDGSTIIFATMGIEAYIGETLIVQDNFESNELSPRGFIAKLNSDGTLAWVTKTSGITIKEFQESDASANTIIATGEIGGDLFIAAIDTGDGSVDRASEFSGISNLGYHQWEVDIVSDNTIALAGTIFDDAPAKVAGRDLIDLDPEWSIYLASVTADIPIRILPDVKGVATSIVGNGKFKEGVMLSAGTVTGDPDGNGTVNSYQWFFDDIPINGATDPSYLTTSTGCGTYKVAIAYLDDGTPRVSANAESPEIIVGKANNGNGTVGRLTSSIPEIFREGCTLIAGAIVDDPDGISSSQRCSYQWYRDNLAITNATQKRFTVPDAGFGAYRVAITYRDAQGYRETVRSPLSYVGRVLAGSDLPDEISGTIGQDLITGLGGSDLLAGGAGSDAFNYHSLSESRLYALDWIQDFVVGKDLIDAPTSVSAANALELGVIASLTPDGIESLLSRSTFKANRAATFSCDGVRGLRTFLALNDSVAGFDHTLDGLIEITGYRGSLAMLEIV